MSSTLPEGVGNRSISVSSGGEPYRHPLGVRLELLERDARRLEQPAVQLPLVLPREVRRCAEAARKVAPELVLGLHLREPGDPGGERHHPDLVMDVHLAALQERGGREDVVREGGRLRHEQVAHDQELERRERLDDPPGVGVRERGVRAGEQHGAQRIRLAGQDPVERGHRVALVTHLVEHREATCAERLQLRERALVVQRQVAERQRRGEEGAAGFAQRAEQGVERDDRPDVVHAVLVVLETVARVERHTPAGCAQKPCHLGKAGSRDARLALDHVGGEVTCVGGEVLEADGRALDEVAVVRPALDQLSHQAERESAVGPRQRRHVQVGAPRDRGQPRVHDDERRPAAPGGGDALREVGARVRRVRAPHDHAARVLDVDAGPGAEDQLVAAEPADPAHRVVGEVVGAADRVDEATRQVLLLGEPGRPRPSRRSRSWRRPARRSPAGARRSRPAPARGGSPPSRRRGA